jgi:hypothetical protein
MEVESQDNNLALKMGLLQCIGGIAATFFTKKIRRHGNKVINLIYHLLSK